MVLENRLSEDKKIKKEIFIYKIAYLVLLAGAWIGSSIIERNGMNNREREYKNREQRIVEFYQRHGSCPSDATPAYLDLRVQLWEKEVDNYSEAPK